MRGLLGMAQVLATIAYGIYRQLEHSEIDTEVRLNSDYIYHM